jgi:hypothetical protein
MFQRFCAYLQQNPVNPNDLIKQEEYVLLGNLLKSYDANKTSMKTIVSQLQDLDYEPTFIEILCSKRKLTQNAKKPCMEVANGILKFQTLTRLLNETPSKKNVVIVFNKEDYFARSVVGMNFNQKYARKYVLRRTSAQVDLKKISAPENCHKIFMINVNNHTYKDFMVHMDLIIFSNISQIFHLDEQKLKPNVKIIGYMIDTLNHKTLCYLHDKFEIQPGSLSNYDFSNRIKDPNYKPFDFVLWKWFQDKTDCLQSFFESFEKNSKSGFPNLRNPETKTDLKGLCICSSELAAKKYFDLMLSTKSGTYFYLEDFKGTTGLNSSGSIVEISVDFWNKQTDSIIFTSRNNVCTINKYLPFADFIFTLEVDMLTNFDIGNCLRLLGTQSILSQPSVFIPYDLSYVNNIISLYEIIEDIHCIPESESNQDLVVQKLDDRIAKTVVRLINLSTSGGLFSNKSSAQTIDLFSNGPEEKLICGIHLFSGFGVENLESDVFGALGEKYPGFANEEAEIDIIDV